jgi:hypothetical protein
LNNASLHFVEKNQIGKTYSHVLFEMNFIIYTKGLNELYAPKFNLAPGCVHRIEYYCPAKNRISGVDSTVA